MRRIDVRDGIRLAVEVHGEGEPLVLIMGIGAQLVFWPADLIQGLVRQGFQVITFDNRDCGESTWLDGVPTPQPLSTMTRALAGLSVPAPYTLWDMADDTVHLLDALGHDTAHVAGISLGGMVAQCVAIKHPTRVRSLASMHSTTGSRRHSIGDPRAYAALLSKRPQTRDEAGETLVRFYQKVGSTGFQHDWDEVRDRGRLAFDRGSNPAGFLRQWAAIMATGARDEALRKLDVPTVVVHGAVDRLIPTRAGRHTARCIRDARLEVIEGLGHDLPPGVRGRIVQHLAWNAGRASS